MSTRSARAGILGAMVSLVVGCARWGYGEADQLLRDGGADRGSIDRSATDGSRENGHDASGDAPWRDLARADRPHDAPADQRLPETMKPPDSRPPDSRPPDSRPPDSRPPDSRPPDSRPPDSRPPDSKLPDGSGPLPPTQTPRLVSCSTQIVDLGEKSLPFQKIFDDRSALGYDPLWMDTFVEGGGESLSYIWVPNAISGWGSWWGQTLANYQTKITGYQVGYQIVNVESLPTGGWLHYGMLVHAPAVPFVHAEEQTEAAYASYVSGLVGYRPVAVAYVEWNSQMLVTSAHRKWSTGVTATAEHLAPTAFATLNVSQNAKNLYLTHLNAYTQGGQIRFSGVWNDVAYTSALFLHGLEKTALQAEIGTQCSTKQLPLRLVTGYENGAVVQYAAFWAK